MTSILNGIHMIIDEMLYQQIVKVMPITCVDLVVVDDLGRVLLLKRTNEPARDEWWFPGGRVYYLETRADAATRKLREECGLEAHNLIELGTFDVIVERSDTGDKLHGVTTVYIANVSSDTTFILDEQTSSAEWQLPSDWLKYQLNPFIERTLSIFAEYNALHSHYDFAKRRPEKLPT